MSQAMVTMVLHDVPQDLNEKMPQFKSPLPLINVFALDFDWRQ